MFLPLIWVIFLSGFVTNTLVGPLLGVSGFGLSPYTNLLYTGGVAFFVAAHFAKHGAISTAQGPHLWYSGVIFTLGVMAAVGFIYGFAMQWPEIYILGDTTYAVMGILVFLAAKYLAVRQIDEQQWAPFTRHLTWIAAIIILMLLAQQGGISFRFKLLFLAVGMLILMADKPRRLNAAIMFIPLLLVLADTNRTMVVVFVVLVGCLFFVYQVRLRLVFATTIAVVAIAATLYGTNMAGTTLGARVDEMTSLLSGGGRITKEQITLYQRIVETRLVWQETKSANAIEIVFGHGAGAVLDMSRVPDESVTGAALLGGGNVHAIHILPVAIFYRHGIVGVLWLAMIAAITVLTLWQLRYSASRRMDKLYVFCAMYPLASMTNGMAASTHFITDFLVFVCLGYVAGREASFRRRQKDRFRVDELAAV